MKKYLLILPLLFLFSNAQAQFAPSRYFKAGILTTWGKTDTSLVVNFDSLAYRNSQIQRLLDSLKSTLGTAVREELKYDASGNFSNGANDSTNVLIDGTGYQIIPFAYDMYADRIMIETAKPGALGPSTWRNDLPKVTTDSLMILRLSRNASFSAGARIGLTLYKVDRATGLSFTNTSGTFYDMLRFDEAQFNAAGTSTAYRLLILLKKNR